MYNIGLDEIREDENEFFETREQEIVRFLSSFEFSEDALNSIHEDTQIQTDLAVLGPDASKHEIRRILLHSQNESSETPYIYLWENSEMKTVFLNIHLGSSGSQSDLDKLGENDDLIALLKAYYVQEYYLIYGGDLNADVLQKDIQDAFLKLINATWYSDKLFDMSVGISDKTRGMSNQQILTKLFKQDYKAKDVILAFNPRLKERDPDRIMTLDYSGSFQRLAEDNGINITTSQAKLDHPGVGVYLKHANRFCYYRNTLIGKVQSPHADLQLESYQEALKEMLLPEYFITSEHPVHLCQNVDNLSTEFNK